MTDASIPMVAAADEPSGFAPADGVVQFRGVELVSPGGARVQLVAGDAAPPGRQVVTVDGHAVLAPITIPDLVVSPGNPANVAATHPGYPCVVEAVYVRVLESSGVGGANLIAVIDGKSFSLGPFDPREGAVSGGRPRGSFWTRFVQWLVGSSDPAVPWTGGTLNVTSVSSGSAVRAAITLVTRRLR